MFYHYVHLVVVYSFIHLLYIEQQVFEIKKKRKSRKRTRGGKKNKLFFFPSEFHWKWMLLSLKRLSSLRVKRRGKNEIYCWCCNLFLSGCLVVFKSNTSKSMAFLPTFETPNLLQKIVNLHVPRSLVFKPIFGQNLDHEVFDVKILRKGLKEIKPKQ